MPWQLTTPYSGGDLDSSGVYNQVKVLRLNWRVSPKPSVSLDLEYGTTVDDVWIPGLAPVGKPTVVYIDGDDYVSFMTHVSNDAELTYGAVKRGVYEWLSAQGHVDAGSIV